MKKSSGFRTKTTMATGLGAALFAPLFMYVKIPTGIPETDIQTACGIRTFLGTLFGPIAGGLVAFIGYALPDSIQYGSAWWSWIIANGTSCFSIGLVCPKLYVEDGEFSGKGVITPSVYQIIASAIVRIVVVPIPGIVIYAEPMNLVFIQGVVTAIGNMVPTGVIGTALLIPYSETRSKKEGLSKG